MSKLWKIESLSLDCSVPRRLLEQSPGLVQHFAACRAKESHEAKLCTQNELAAALQVFAARDLSLDRGLANAMKRVHITFVDRRTNELVRAAGRSVCARSISNLLLNLRAHSTAAPATLVAEPQPEYSRSERDPHESGNREVV